MRTSICLATAVAILLCSGSATRDVSGQTTGTNVVVIDIPYVFKNHVRFKAAIDDIKKDIDAYKKFVTDQQAQVRAERERLGQFKPGTREYKEIEERIARMSMEAQLKGAQQQKDFMEREAQEYYKTYGEVQAAVAEFASRNGIALVLRYNSQEIDPTKRESIMQGVNGMVVYQNGLNITELILDRLNRGTPRAPISNPTVPGRPSYQR